MEVSSHGRWPFPRLPDGIFLRTMERAGSGMISFTVLPITCLEGKPVILLKAALTEVKRNCP